ncbi:putative dioxygenase [Streptomyces bingchenggensis BCW-1]|uniref:Putative dioxygenase n=1 Tax=Streptomyces bingchenggensis (strain BCW-1) TaxID=749414 RepID=D7BW96_STRBB|nr:MULTISPECIES: alpha/beta hydrolase [Streptomyces]ADI11806.1 putative dioxygenase [Streptomyces bingchenggensis BCW-1]
MINTITLNGTQIAFDEHGIPGPGPAIVLLPGWCHDHRYYDRLLRRLAPEHRVIRVNWRGHGPDRTPVADFGIAEQTADTIALLDALDMTTFVPVAHAHGGWVALEMAEELGPQRVPQLLIVDLIMTQLPPDFHFGLQAMQQRETWVMAREGLAQSWMAGSSNEHVTHHALHETGGFGFDMWSRSCRVIENAYNTWGSPMARMEQLTHPRPVRHVFAHPKVAEYDALHEDFRSRNPWFSYTRLEGETHFPALEQPEQVAAELNDFLKGAPLTARGGHPD